MEEARRCGILIWVMGSVPLEMTTRAGEQMEEIGPVDTR